MIDGVNILCTKTGEGKIQLERTFQVDERTGEILKHEAKYCGFRLLVNPTGRLIGKGSIHKYKNQGRHNYDNYNFSELLEVIADLETDFGVEAETTKITRLEIGVNINPHIATADLLTAIMLHKSRAFNTIREPGKYHKYVNYTEYTVKAYDKGLQYERPEQIFRFEIVLRKRKLRDAGVQTLEDLKTPSIYNDLGELLISEFNRCIIIDQPDYSTLCNREALYIKDWMNPNYTGQLSPEYIRKGIKKLQVFLDTNSLNKYHKITENLIAKQVSKNQYVESNRIPFFTEVNNRVNLKGSYPVFHHLDKEEILTPQSSP